MSVYEATVYKMIQRDNFETGPEGPSTDFGTVFTFKSSDLTLIKDRLESAGFTFNADGEGYEHQLEYSQSEDANGDLLTDHAAKAFKAGKTVCGGVWCADYTLRITEIIESELDFKTLLKIVGGEK